MSEPVLSQLIAGLAGGRIRIVDLTQTLSPDFPQIVLPPGPWLGVLCYSAARTRAA